MKPWASTSNLDANGPSRKVQGILQERYNVQAPKSVSTIEHWSSWFGWVETAARHDAEIAEIEQRKLAAKEAKERVRRHEARLQDADLVRAVARAFLVIQPVDEQGTPIPGAGRPRQRGELTARDLEVAAVALARAAQGERQRGLRPWQQ